MAKQINVWTFTGEIFYLKELEGEFSASLKLRGTAQRDGAFSMQIAEISCLLQSKIWTQLKEQQIKQYDTVTLSGHLESWNQNSHGKPVRKIMLIADSLVDVQYKVWKTCEQIWQHEHTKLFQKVIIYIIFLTDCFSHIIVSTLSLFIENNKRGKLQSSSLLSGNG